MLASHLRNVARAALAATVAGLAVVAPAPSATAAGSCNITNWGPRSVVIGLSPVKRTFSVTSDCSGSTDDSHWSINIVNGPGYMSSNYPSSVFYRPYTNSEARAYDVVVEATHFSDDRNSSNIYIGAFRLKRQTSIRFNASPEPVRYRSPLSLSGQLLRANWDTDKYDALSRRTVAVQFRTATGPYSTVKTVTTDRSGRVATTVTATRSGVWRLYYPGNSVEGASSSVVDAVAVAR